MPSCPDCNGTGLVSTEYKVSRTCQACHGTRITSHDTAQCRLCLKREAVPA